MNEAVGKEHYTRPADHALAQRRNKAVRSIIKDILIMYPTVTTSQIKAQLDRDGISYRNTVVEDTRRWFLDKLLKERTL